MNKKTLLLLWFICLTAKADIVLDSDIKYCVDISGKYKQLYDEIFLSDLMTDKTKIVPNMYVLKSRVSRFISLVEQTFCAHGYFDISVNYQTSKTKSNNTCININIDAGEIYKISKVNVIFQDSKNLDITDNLVERLQAKKFLMQTAGQPATYKLVDELAQRVQNYFLKRGYPFVSVLNKIIDLDHKTHTAKIQIEIKLGEKLLFGSTTIRGARSVAESYVRNRIYWVPNSVYNIDMVENTVYDLSNSQIFSKADIFIDKENINHHIAPIIIELTEDKKRSIELGIFYSTVKSYNFQKLSSNKKNLRSLYTSICLSHYNLFNHGETAKFRIFGSPFSLNHCRSSHDYEISLDFIKPDLLVSKDSATFSGAFSRNNQNAYYMLSKNIGSFWTSPFVFRDVRIRMGAFLEDNSVTGPFNSNQKYKSCSFPVVISYDKRDSILNPTNGYKTALNISPIFMSGGSNITKINLYATQVFRLFHNPNAIFAYWLSGSRIFQRDLNDIPLDKRIYAGGRSSIRGYGNQMAGPLYKTAQNKETDYPIGGTSSIEAGAEIRKHLYKEISGVVFVESAALGSLKRWYTGFGIGLRYKTVLGPVRLDVAFPAKRRHNIDNRFHFYLSFGQAF